MSDPRRAEWLTARRQLLFWAKVDRRGPDECWPWKGGHVPDGYGVICLPMELGRWGWGTVKVHRYAYFLEHGSLPPAGLQVLHRCDVRDCVNVAHLFVGTNADNVADRVSKGRSASQRGERNPRAKLTPAQVAEIRAMGGGTNTAILAARFGVSMMTIQNAIAGRTWRPE